MGHTHNRAQRFGGHTKHAHYCSCGRIVRGNGGKQHFKLDGHRPITQRKFAALVPADRNTA